MPVSHKTKLKNKADRLFSLYVRRDGKCQLAGLDNIRCGGGLQCMHIVSRSNYRLRWDEMNALCGCQGHHIFYTVNPFDWFEVIKSEFPDRYEYIMEHKLELWDKDTQAAIDKYEKLLDSLRNKMVK